MKVLPIIGAIASMVFTLGSMLTMWVFSAASLANNTSEESLHRVKLWVLGFSILSVAGIAIGIWLLSTQRSGLASIFSLLPALIMGSTLLYLLLGP